MNVDDWFNEGERPLSNGWRLELSPNPTSKDDMLLFQGKRKTSPDQFYVALEIRDFSTEGAKGSLRINIESGRGLEFFTEQNQTFFYQTGVILLDLTCMAVQLNAFTKKVIENGKN